jgi:hypothetical protein
MKNGTRLMKSTVFGAIFAFLISPGYFFRALCGTTNDAVSEIGATLAKPNHLNGNIFARDNAPGPVTTTNMAL